jgi:glycosyltransferase involved in cell wall biosynthesis
MRIAILGTKGIPNNYGGFEQFAEYISKGLVVRGHEVTVYNPHFHPYKNSALEGVKVKRIFSPEGQLGASANFIYDFLCLQDALKGNFDIIYEAGYHSVAPAYQLLGIRKRSQPIIITNMDGLEWRRSKWNRVTKLLIKKLEKIAVSHSHYLISDNEGIQDYYKRNFEAASFFLPYGADMVSDFDVQLLTDYNLDPYQFHLLIARLEPENNIEMILDGYCSSGTTDRICVIGNVKSKYGKFLRKKYESTPTINFLGAIYDKRVLDALRYFAAIYFHGHSVGGTNPSLLEAMACRAFIAAHSNEFNKSVLNTDAMFFNDALQVASLIRECLSLREKDFKTFEKNNALKIATRYSWPNIIAQHEQLFFKVLGRN